MSHNCLNVRALVYGAAFLIGVSSAARAELPPQVQETLALARQEDVPPGAGQPPRIEVEVPAPRPTTPDNGPFTASFGGVAEAFSTDVEGPFLPDVQGTHIYQGKKTENIDLRRMPPIINNNLRQALSRTPGLIVSEESSPLLSIGYRGLEPHRGQFTQILQDGIPIHADMFGYPEAYYTPPLQFVERIDFIHGGASLMYGPQPGGALNFVTNDPDPNTPFSFFTEDVLGTHDFFSTSNAASGTSGPLGYYVYQHHRQSNGFRSANSYFDVNYGGTKIITQLSPTARTIFSFNLYDERHGEPGGLTRANFAAGSNAASRLYDKFQLRRYAGWIGYQEEVTPDVLFEAKAWATYYSRFSRRQNGGGFGTLPTGLASATANFELQEFRTLAFENRLRADYGDEGQHVFAGGLMFYHVDSPRTDSTGPFDTDAGRDVARANEREVNYFSMFAENRFEFGKLGITPGVRLENVWQGLTEQVNVARTTAGLPLQETDIYDFAPLFGLGVTYDTTDTTRIYTNISQAYRPVTFGQAIVAGSGTTVSGDLASGTSWQTDIGMRGNPTPYFTWDISLFYMEFDNQIGQLGTVITNVGDSVHKGVESFAELGITALHDDLQGTNLLGNYGGLTLFAAHMYLDAKFIAGGTTGALGNVVGNTPQYAPNYQLKVGTAYTYGKTRIQFAGAYLDDQFGNDSNSANFYIPNYNVWDLTSNFQLTSGLSVVAGVNNVFNQRYFSRVRADGIDPADGTNYYLGGRLNY